MAIAGATCTASGRTKRSAAPYFGRNKPLKSMHIGVVPGICVELHLTIILCLCLCVNAGHSILCVCHCTLMRTPPLPRKVSQSLVHCTAPWVTMLDLLCSASASYVWDGRRLTSLSLIGVVRFCTTRTCKEYCVLHQARGAMSATKCSRWKR